MGLFNFKRKSRNFKPELKNLKKNSKPNVLLELKLKNNAPSFQENLKNFLKDSKKLVAPLLPKLNSTSVAKLRWPNSDVILRNPILLTNPLYLHSVKSKPIKSANFLNL